MQSMICILLLVVAALCCDSTAHAAQYSETDEENLCRFGAVYGQLISGMSFLSSFAQQNYNETIQLSSRALNLNNLVAMDDDTMQSIKEMAYNVGDDIYALKQIVNSEIIGMRNFVDKIKNDYQLDSEGRRVATAASAAFTQCYNEQTNNWKTMEEELEELASNLDTLREMIKQQSINSDDDETMEQYISRTMGNTGIFKPRVNADTLAETYAFLIKSIKTYVYGISQKRTELESAVIGVLKPALIAKVAECQQFYRSVSVSAHDEQSSASVSCKIFDNRLNAMQAGSNYSGYLTYLNERWDRASSEKVVNDIMKIAGGSGGLVELLRQPVDYIELSPPDRYEYNAGVILSIAVFILLVLLFACTAICCSKLCNCCSRSCETDRNATATAWCYERMPQETQFPQNYTTAVYMGKPVCTV